MNNNVEQLNETDRRVYRRLCKDGRKCNKRETCRFRHECGYIKCSKGRNCKFEHEGEEGQVIEQIEKDTATQQYNEVTNKTNNKSQTRSAVEDKNLQEKKKAEPNPNEERDTKENPTEESKRQNEESQRPCYNGRYCSNIKNETCLLRHKCKYGIRCNHKKCNMIHPQGNEDKETQKQAEPSKNSQEGMLSNAVHSLIAEIKEMKRDIVELKSKKRQ